MAVNRPDVDYVRCARQLASSIRRWHPHSRICLATNGAVDADEFDYIEQLPYGDQLGLANDWQAWSVSPFRETIKLEADMLAAGPIDHWWTLLRLRDVVISVGARNFYDEPALSRFYRKTFDTNDLPDVYNAITYWRVSETALEFWRLVRNIFSAWSQYRQLLQFPEDTPSTDVVYAMAARIMGDHRVTLPRGLGPQIVHMKPHMIPLQGKNWTQELVWEHAEGVLRINTVAQWGMVHYHHKDWLPNGQ